VKLVIKMMMALGLFEETDPEARHFHLNLTDPSHLRKIVYLAGSALHLSKDYNLLKQSIRIFPLACHYGLEGLVSEIIGAFSVEEIRPECFNNYAIRKSSEYGHSGIVKLLLNLSMVDPTVDRQYALIRACANGHTDTVLALLTHPSIDPCARSHYALRTAATNGHIPIVRILLKYYNSLENNSDALVWACTLPYEKVMQELQKCPGFDVSGRYNYAIQWASRTGQLNMVKYLVTCKGVDPTVNNNYAYYWANRNGHSDVAEFLVSLPGVVKVNIWDGVEPGNKPKIH